MISLAGCVAVPTAGCRPVVPSFWKEGLGVVEKNDVRHICFICCDRVCSATTPHPSSPEEGITLGARHCSGRRPPPAPPKEGSNRVCPYRWVYRS